MKIVYVMTRSDVIGGAGVHLLDLAEGMKNSGHDVTIIVGGKGVFLEHAIDKGFKCIPLKHMLREIHLLNDIFGFLELRRIIQSCAPDIIHLHSSKAGLIGRMVSKSLKIPSVFTVHGWAFTEGVPKKRRIIYRTIEKLMVFFSDKIITVSEYDKNLALTSGVGSVGLITTIHNGIHDFASVTKVSDNYSPRMIMVARFDEPKNQSALLRALATIKHLSWEMEFVGDGPLLNNARKDTEELGLNERVIFSGACNDVAKRLTDADIFLLISNWEALPLTILEAMRASLPVVASNVGGIPELVENEVTGFLINRNDTVGLASSIELLLKNLEMRSQMGTLGRKKYEAGFTYSKMLDKTLVLYNSLLRDKK